MADNDKLSPYDELIDLIANLPVLVRETRRRRGLSIRATAEATGMSFATISRAESGSTLQGDNLTALLRFVGDLDVTTDAGHSAAQQPRGATHVPGVGSTDTVGYSGTQGASRELGASPVLGAALRWSRYSRRSVSTDLSGLRRRQRWAST